LKKYYTRTASYFANNVKEQEFKVSNNYYIKNTILNKLNNKKRIIKNKSSKNLKVTKIKVTKGN